MQRDKRFVKEKHDAQFILQMHNQYCFAIVQNREHNPSPRLFMFKKMFLFCFNNSEYQYTGNTVHKSCGSLHFALINGEYHLYAKITSENLVFQL